MSAAIDGYLYEKNLTVSQLLLKYLKLEAVCKLFGIPGSTLAYVLREVREQSGDLEFIVCRHESGAVYIAHGYSIVADRPGVVLAGAGPGATNALTGALNAHANGAAVLVITGEVDQQFFGRGYLQEGVETGPNINEIYQSAVAYSAVISDQANFPTLLQQALREMLSLPRRTAHLSLPADISAQCVDLGKKDEDGNNLVPVPRHWEVYRTEPRAVDREQIEAALERLALARRPLIFLGNGCRRALRNKDLRDKFEQFVRKFAFPVMTTPHAKGIFSERHELSLRNYGMTACCWPQAYVDASGDPGPFDALLVLGSSLGQLATAARARGRDGKALFPRDHFIQVDLDQSVIGRNFPITLGIVAEAGATIELLCELGDQPRFQPTAGNKRARLVADVMQDSAFEEPDWRRSEKNPVHPAALMRVISEVMNEEADKAGGGHLFIDAGNCAGWSLHYMEIVPPLEYHIPIDMAPMGFAVGAVIGGKVAAPDKPCVAVVGDGAFLMHGAEVSTAAQNRVGAVWVVLYDNDLGMTSQGIAEDFKERRKPYALGKPNLAGFARALGAEANVVTLLESPKQFSAKLTDALDRARRWRPQVIVVRIPKKPAPPHHWPGRKKPLCGPRKQ